MRKYLHAVCIAGFLLCMAGAYYLAAVAHDTASLAPHTLGRLTCIQYSLAALCMLGAWSTTAGYRFQHYRWILMAGIAARLILIPVDSYTSNDSDRYLWDGSVAVYGHDPYRVSADAPEVADLRPIWPTPPEHARYPTVYPPLSIATFAAVAASGPAAAPKLWKLLVTLAGLATLLLAVYLLRHAGQTRHLALIALSPLLVLETGVGAHVDALMALAVTAALLAWQRGRYVWLGVMIGIGALYKLLPIVLLLPVMMHLGFNRHSRTVLTATAITVLAGYGAALLLGWQAIGILGTFAEKWRFGSPVFTLLESLFSGVSLIMIIGGLLLAGFGVIAWIAKKQVIQSMQWALASPLLLSPVVFPWYLSVLVPLLALRPSAFLLLWMCALPLTYEVLGGFVSAGVWMPAAWPLITLAVCWILGLAMDQIKAKNCRSGFLSVTTEPPAADRG